MFGWTAPSWAVRRLRRGRVVVWSAVDYARSTPDSADQSGAAALRDVSQLRDVKIVHRRAVALPFWQVVVLRHVRDPLERVHIAITVVRVE